MVGIAAVFGLLAVFVAQGWLNYQAEPSRKVVQPKAKPVATRTIVIAAGPMRFGTHVSADNLKEVTWPDEALPAGTFGSIAEVMSGNKRIVLASIEKNEPILRSKITGPGQKATLSAVIQDGMRAVTVRVNDVEGVGGFVLPGDHVDVVLTRHRQGVGYDSSRSAEHTRTRRRSNRRRACAESRRRQIGDAGSRYGRRTETVALIVCRQPFSVAAQGRRDGRSAHTQGHARGSVDPRTGR